MGRLLHQFTPGQRFRTPGRTITEADIAAFAGLTGDYNPVHTDAVFAAATGFGGPIAHGPMLVGMAFGLAARLDLIDGTVIALLGIEWGFKAPVRAGDTIHAVIGVVEARNGRQPDRGVLALSFDMVNQAGTVAQTGLARLLMRRTAQPEAAWGEVPSEADAPSK